jgi:hypothetical protein
MAQFYKMFDIKCLMDLLKNFSEYIPQHIHNDSCNAIQRGRLGGIRRCIDSCVRAIIENKNT